MNTRCRKFLQDICDAGARIERFALGKSLQDYTSDEFLRSAVERQLITIGEATTALLRDDPVIAAELGDVKRVSAFRNILVHAYFQVNNEIVWEVVEQFMPALLEKARAQLKK